MTNVVTNYNNFARAKIDHDMNGRFDLPIYTSGADDFENFISNFKGNSIYRAGIEFMLEYEDCAFVEFKFSNNQNYLLVLTNGKMRFLSYDVNGDFGWVESSPGVPLEVTTPYTLAESETIALGKPAQNKDAMVFTHKGHEPYKLVRTAANAFTFRVFARKDDPFAKTFAATKTITAVSQAANAQVTAAAHGYSVGDRVRHLAVAGMTQLNGWTARVVSVVDPNNYTIDVDTTTFTAYSSGGTAEKVLTGDYPHCCVYNKGRLWYANTPLKITTAWGSEAGQYDILTIPTVVTDDSAMQITIAELAEEILWLFSGENSLIAGSNGGIIAINGGGVNTAIKADTVEANLTSAEPANSAYPLMKDSLIFYVGRNGRNVYSFTYDLLTEKFVAEDANFISYDITQGKFSKIRYKKDRNDLVFCLRGDGDLCSMNFNVKEKIVGWHEHNTTGTFEDFAQISDNEGDPQFFTLIERGGSFYIGRQAGYVEFKKRIKFFTEPEAPTPEARKAAKAIDDEAYNRYVGEQLKDCIYLDSSQVVSNLKAISITYNPGTGIITAAAPAFASLDEGKHIAYKTLTGYESGRFLITNYIDTTHVEVSVLQAPTANTYDSWYLSFSSISGASLAQYEDTEISVVTDGGYLSDFPVDSGLEIDLNSQYTHAVIGYKYKGIIKSFTLGFQYQAINTQVTIKDIGKASMRFVASMGGKFGTSLYKMEAIQELSQNDLNYLPPLPMDGTKDITYSDDGEVDKCFYIVQEEPLPLQVTAVMLEGSYTFSE